MTKEEALQWFLEKGSELISDWVQITGYPIICLCSKCKSSFTYSSFKALRKQNPKLLCTMCSGRTLDVDKIKQKVLSEGAVFKGMDKYRLSFLCKECNKEVSLGTYKVIDYFEKKYGIPYHFKCMSCYKLERVLNFKNSNIMTLKRKQESFEKKAKNWFIEQGSELLSKYTSDEGSVSFKCVCCGEVGFCKSFYRLRLRETPCLCENCISNKRSQDNIKKFLKKDAAFVAQYLENLNSRLIQYNEISKNFSGTCSKCGEETKRVNFQKFYSSKKPIKLLCGKCRKESLVSINSKPLQEIEEWFKQQGVTLIKCTGNLERVYFKCKNCGGDAEYNTFSGLRNCNPKCFCFNCNFENRCGSNAYNFNPSLSEEERMKGRSAHDLYEWYLNTEKAHEKKCVITGKVENLHRHHIYNWADYGSLRECVWNCVFLETSVHYQYHTLYGKKNNTYASLKDFVYSLTGKEHFAINKNNLVIDIILPSCEIDLKEKKKEFFEKGIEYIPVLEKELLHKTKCIDSIILAKTGIIRKFTKHHARKLIVEEKSFSGVSSFLEENHRQGACRSSVNLCLVDPKTKEIVSCMTFSKPRFNKNFQYELIRFCSKNYHIVPGAASKLFSYFLKKYNPESILSYSDLRFSSLDPVKTVYTQIGMQYSHTSDPNYFYEKDGVFYSRVAFQKHKLADKLRNFDPDLSEKENMLLNGYSKRYDCGNLVFIWKKFI